MSMTRLIAAFTLALALTLPASCAGQEKCGIKSSASLPREVSIIALLADPERFDGCEISVVGVYGGGIAWSKLFASSEYLEQGIEAGSINLHFPVTEDQAKVSDAVEGRFVLVSGVFRVETSPLDGSKRGIVDPVSRFEPIAN